MELNKSQELVVRTHEGPVLAIACPGSGKTTVLLERIHNMIQSGISGTNMLVTTFTKAAAEEMSKRYKKKYTDNGPNFSTIHSFCFNVIRNVYGYTANDILKGGEVLTFFRELPLICRDDKITDIDEFIKDIVSEISAVRNSETDLYSYTAETCKTEKFLKIFEAYRAFKKENNKIDFDDMLFICRECLSD